MFADLNSLDMALIGVLGMAVLIGGLRGISKMVFSWLLWIGVGYILYNYCYTLAHTPVLDKAVGNEFLQVFMVFTIGVVGAFVFSAIFQMILGRLISAMGLVIVDKFLGLYLGFIQGVLLVGVLILSFSRTPVSEESWWGQSKIVGLTTYYAPIYSKGYVEIVENTAQKIDDQLLPFMQVQGTTGL